MYPVTAGYSPLFFKKMPQVVVKDFRLENGSTLENIRIAYQTFGSLNAERNNVVWVCHALTANADVTDWWKGLFGKNDLFDPKEYFIVCVNTIGSCYGSTGPVSPRENKRPLLDKFPKLTNRDAVQALDLVRESLNLERIHLLVGASLGGQQALEWSIARPEVFEALVLIATNARHSAWGIAWNESQRLAIKADHTYGNGNLFGGEKGLQAARSIALLSYRSSTIYNSTQTEATNELQESLKAAEYQRYQGEKLVKRFNAYSYVCLSEMMDSHNVGRNRASIETALKVIKARTLVIGITSDQLFPLEEQKFLAQHISGAEYAEISSACGHDGFLVETTALTLLLEDFLFNNFRKHKPTVFRTTVRKNQLINLIG